MNGTLSLILLLLFVLLAFVLPVRRRRVTFDEKGEAIKVYQEEVAHLDRQRDKQFIDETEHAQLLAELDKKSALAITRIEKKSYDYRRSLVPLVLIFLGIVISSTLYYRHYQQSGAMRWQFFNDDNRGIITEGLFDAKAVESFVSRADNQSGAAYCFAMQQALLKQYDTNPDALGNLAQCYLMTGYPQLANDAIVRGLKGKPMHGELNYLAAELDYLQNKRLSPASLDRLLLAIKQNPNHFKTLQLLAINSLNQGDYQQARFFFSQLKKLAKGNTQLLAALEKVDADIAQKLAEQSKQSAQAHSTVTASPKKPATAQSNTAAPSTTSSTVSDTKASTTASTTDKRTDSGNHTLTADISISPEMAQSLSGQQTVFIVVKSTDGQLINAVKRVVSDFNQTLSISIKDNQADMMQMQAMNDFQQVTIIARISRNGSPIASSGDLTSATASVRFPQDGIAHLVIDRVVP